VSEHLLTEAEREKVMELASKTVRFFNSCGESARVSQAVIVLLYGTLLEQGTVIDECKLPLELEEKVRARGGREWLRAVVTAALEATPPS